MTHFAKPATREHGVRARADAIAQSVARRLQTNFGWCPAQQWFSRGAMHYGERSSSKQAYFDGANDFLLIGGRNFSGGFRVELFQNCMEMTRGMRRGTRAESFTDFFRALRQFCQPFEQRAQIESGTNGEDRQLGAQFQIGEDAF